MTEHEKIERMRDMLRRMCEAMKCEDCPLSIEGDISKLIVDGGICELAIFVVASMGGAE